MNIYSIMAILTMAFVSQNRAKLQELCSFLWKVDYNDRHLDFLGSALYNGKACVSVFTFEATHFTEMSHSLFEFLIDIVSVSFLFPT
jgi:hypothetical protein